MLKIEPFTTIEIRSNIKDLGAIDGGPVAPADLNAPWVFQSPLPGTPEETPRIGIAQGPLRHTAQNDVIELDLTNKGLMRLLAVLQHRTGLNKSELARGLGMSRATIHHVAKGAAPSMSLARFVKLLDLTGGRVLVELPPRRGNY